MSLITCDVTIFLLNQETDFIACGLGSIAFNFLLYVRVFLFLRKRGKKREKKKKLVPLDIIRDHFNIKSTSKKFKRSRVSFLWFSKI